MGRIILDNGDIYDGNFKRGQFHGHGAFYNKQNNTHIIGVFSNNKCVKKIDQGVGFPS